MELNFCPVCGTRLSLRPQPLPGEGSALWCEDCRDWRFPLYSCAVSGILLDKRGEKLMMIRQYGEQAPVLVAGYVDKGETAEAALLREVREELGMTARRPRFLGSHYYAPSQTLMLNFLAGLEEDEASPNAEVDAWEWLPVSEARARVKPGGLARILLDQWDGSPIVNP